MTDVAPLISVIASAGNVAVAVLLVVLAGAWRLYREQRDAEREARAKDAEQYVASTDRQTDAVREVAKALTELRIRLRDQT